MGIEFSATAKVVPSSEQFYSVVGAFFLLLPQLPMILGVGAGGSDQVSFNKSIFFLKLSDQFLLSATKNADNGHFASGGDRSLGAHSPLTLGYASWGLSSLLVFSDRVGGQGPSLPRI